MPRHNQFNPSPIADAYLTEQSRRYVHAQYVIAAWDVADCLQGLPPLHGCWYEATRYPERYTEEEFDRHFRLDQALRELT